MSFEDVKNEAEELGGKAKESLGKATENENLEFEGKTDQIAADVKKKASEAADKAKGLVNDTIDKFKNDKSPEDK